MIEDNYIKLRVPGESFWATKISEDTASVSNILLDPTIGLHDVVKFNPATKEVITVLEKKTNTYAIKYPTTSDIQETYKIVSNYFEKQGIEVEGMIAGSALLAVPVGIPESKIREITKECLIDLEFLDGNE